MTISYQEPLVFSVSLLCFQILTIKLFLWQKAGLTYAISVVNCKNISNFIISLFFFFFFEFLIIDVP